MKNDCVSSSSSLAGCEGGGERKGWELEGVFLPEWTVTITVRTPALCLLDTSDKSFSLCLPYPSLTLCSIRTDNLISLLIPSFVGCPCSTYDSFLITITVVPCSLI